MFNIIEICLIIASIATSHLILANELFFDQFVSNFELFYSR